MRPPSRPLLPLKATDLEWFALRYVGRYATTRSKLVDYLRRKLRERGWDGEEDPDPVALAQRMADRGYVDDRAYAESKAGAMGRRGLGARRIAKALHFAGVAGVDAQEVEPILEADRVKSALAFARRKRIGPFAQASADRSLQEKQIGAMVRAGHSVGLARRITSMSPGDDPQVLIDGEEFD